MHASIRVANAEFGISFARNRSRDIRAICQFRHLFTPIGADTLNRGGVDDVERERFKSQHSGRATRNANRVYHYDLMDIGSPITLGVDSNVLQFRFRV